MYKSSNLVRTGKTMPFPDGKRYKLCSPYRLNKKIDSACSVIEQATQQVSPWALSCSFGKDSTVLLDILIKQMPDTPIVFSDRGPEAELPETESVIALTKSRYSIFNLVRVYPQYTMFELYDLLCGIPSVDITGDHGLIRKNNLETPIGNWMRVNNYKGHFMGRRIEENPHTRGKHLRVRGPLHFNKRQSIWTCDPLYNWTGENIWAYIARENLPYHPIYDKAMEMNDEGGRERARLSNWTGMVGIAYGRWARLRRDYPKLYTEFVSRFPQIARYT